MGLDPLQVTLDYPGGSGHSLEQYSGWPPHRVHPGAPVLEQLPSFLGILPLIDALKHQPYSVGHAGCRPFQGHRLPLLGFILSPLQPVPEPHPRDLLKPVTLPGVGPALGFPDLIACLHHILDDVKFVVHHLSVPEVLAAHIGVGGSHVDGPVMDRLGMPVLPQQFRSNIRPNGGVLTGRTKSNLLATRSANTLR
jgi:hypothetical protein